jgi:hypothetical protein
MFPERPQITLFHGFFFLLVSCFLRASQFYNNKVIMQQDGAYTNGACSGDAMPLVYNNSVFSPTGAITECGMPLAEWQAKGALASVGLSPCDRVGLVM